ncbi:hypothetical protein F5X98DRAFT_92637 [Xylaria grammica]|nr:hypothetical protein F5X98DRAFT_92637 [Xylaria grammica]
MASTTSPRATKSDARAANPNHMTLTIEDIAGDINENFNSDSEPEFPSLDTIALLRKARQKGEDSWDVWLKVWELETGNHPVTHTPVPDSRRLLRWRKGTHVKRSS